MKEAISDFFTGGSRKSKLPGGVTAGKRFAEAPETKGLEGLIIRLLEASRPPATQVERLAIDFLTREGRISLKKLVEHVARELYSAEVRNGAWALDIGLYGPELFVRDVISEIRSGDQILWSIERPEREGNGLLSNLS
ncbi:MAG: hypothetical protein HYY45_09835 [Deltaproteobacteria bacterium]|nr:hypothetical protein [Deltaproteobacteria bacterium]